MATRVSGTDLDAPVRRTLRRGVLWPSWLVSALLVVPFALGVSVPLVVQYGPLVASVVVLGLPHGAIDHLALPRVRGERPTLRRMGWVVLVYVLLGGAYAVVWFLAPTVAFVFFILLTWAHWGQGDLYALLGFADADYLRTRAQRALTVVVRGGLPMLVPLLFFPDWYRRVASALVDLFAVGSMTRLAWLFQFDTRLALGVGYGLLVVTSLALGYRRITDDADRSAWALDAGETGLLVAYFAAVPPVLAIGVYFCLWHSLRHIARLVLLEEWSRTRLRDHSLGPALARFAREATPLTLVSLALLAGLYVVVPRQPGDILGLVGLYLVFIAVVTLPHVAIVTWMDREQAVWTAEN
jgi:Brp/Blh family beta-carotene 15,15'-monooxygenase